MVEPVFKKKIGQFDVAVFLNERKVGKKTFEVPSVTIRKSWTTDGKNWSEAKLQVFNALEIVKLQALLDDTLKYLLEKGYLKEEAE